MQGKTGRLILVVYGAVAAVAVGFDLALGTGGAGEHSSWLFLGRFHPLVVHLPIGMLLLLGVFELGSLLLKRSQLDAALDLTLPLAALAALVSFLLGHLLSGEGDWAPGRVLLHRQAALITVLGCCAAGATWTAHRMSMGSRWFYRGLLVITLATLSFGAHVGGTLSRGEHYLGQHAPLFLAPLLGGQATSLPAPPAPEPAPGDDVSLFRAAVLPVLEAHCVECHGRDKMKGGLRLDTFEALMKGGDTGPSIVPGDARESLLLQRMRLPLHHDDHMPPSDTAQPSPGQVGVIELWIQRGAESERPLKDVYVSPEVAALLAETIRTEPAVGTRQSGATADSARVPEPTAELPQNSRGAGVDDSAQARPPQNNGGPPSSASELQDPRAILQAYCVECHGPARQKGGLRVDSVAALKAGGKGGPAIVPGYPQSSPLVERMGLPLHDGDHMPPAKKPQPATAETRVLANWIRSMASAGTTDVAALPPTVDSVDGAAPMDNAAPVDLVPSGARDAPPLRGDADTGRLFASVEALFAGKCVDCHDAMMSSGGLNLESYETIVAGGESGPAIVPGNASASLLVTRITLPAAHDEHMPPADYPDLTETEVELVRIWIDQGGTPTASSPIDGLPVRVGALLSRSSPRHSSGEANRPAPEESAPPPASTASSGPRKQAPPSVEPQSRGFLWCAWTPGAPRSTPLSWWMLGLLTIGSHWARRGVPRRRAPVAGPRPPG